MGGIKEFIVGAVEGLGKGAKEVIDSINAPKEAKLEAETKLQELITKHQEYVLGQANDLEKAYLQDVQDARGANSKVQDSANASWMAKNVAYLIDIFICLIWGSLSVYIAAIWIQIIETKADMTGILSLYATVTAVFMTVLNFHRGTSRGSERKQETLDAVMKKAA